MQRFLLVLGVTAALGLVAVESVHAAPTPENRCKKARFEAAAKYASCQLNVLAKDQGGGFGGVPPAGFEKMNAAFSKCRVKYQLTWPRLQVRFPATSCAAARFVDNGDQTVTDNLTGLVWEKKSNSGGAHDWDNTYTWSLGAPWKESGTLFSSFLETTNGLGGFAGSLGWRLPTLAELQTILLPEPYPCATAPCIDAAFGPYTAVSDYWSATSNVDYPSQAWFVYFGSGTVGFQVKVVDFYYARAVRGGL